MLRRIAGILLLCLCFCSGFAQGVISGTITEEESGDPLYGAYIMVGEGQGTTTDFDGKFRLELPDGSYTVTVSYIGYSDQQFKVTLAGGEKRINARMAGEILKEVQVVADYAIDRETPVAFSNVDVRQIEEELASKDIPMLLNSTPGVYATQQGGGDGDARITIRGFSQRNVAVMIDGIPVNDMENGRVFWSNWSGLDVVTSTVQVQRGLGASKLAIPSIGGTMNIITKGIDSKPGLSVRQEIGNNGYTKTSVGYSSGRSEKGWGVTLAGSMRRRDGWVDQTGSIGGFYFARIDKSIGNHLVSVIGSGGPQRHGQRSGQEGIWIYSFERAAALGVDTSQYANRIPNGNFGFRYNENWGPLERRTINPDDTIPGRVEEFNTRYNYYHKPQVSLRHSWQINDRLYLSNVAYVSIGRGAGVRPWSTMFLDDSTGQTQIQLYWDINNRINSIGLRRSTNPLIAQVNNHFWVGGLSTLDFRVNEDLTITTGMDVRSYKGIHQTRVQDLLGGEYFRDGGASALESDTTHKEVGDLIDRDYDGIVRWAGVFGQLEYRKDNWSAFFSGSFSMSGYKRIDRWAAMDLVLPDTTIRQIVGFDTEIQNSEPIWYQTYTHNGQDYTINSPEARFASTPWKYIPAYTLKAGFNYKFTMNHNAYVNAGYLSRNPNFNNVITFSNELFRNIETEKVLGFELGYGMRYPKFALNWNSYYTNWLTQPISRSVFNEQLDRAVSVNFNEISALHMGMEVDFSYQVLQQLAIEGTISFGDWRWTGGDTVDFTQVDPALNSNANFRFDATDVKVGNSAQSQLGLMLRYEPIKRLYFKPRVTFFGRHWADFDPLTLQGANASRQSWRTPDYYTLDFYAGYTFKFDRTRLTLSTALQNLTNNIFITDASNNNSNSGINTQDFDAQSASVFFSQGFQWNIALKLQFSDFKREKAPKE